MTEKLCLKWNDFQQNTNTAFGNLREDNDFSDITLACEDGEQVEAHKVILAASSPFFHSMFRRNKHPHPLIYMRGVESEDLVAIVDFLYYGEANVYQENIVAFLAIAEELKLKGLTGNKEKEKGEEVHQSNKYIEREKKANIKQEPIRKRQKNLTSENIVERSSNEIETIEGTVAVTNFAVSGDLQELDEKINCFISKGESLMPNGNKSVRASACTVCGKEGKLSNIRDHIEANHLEGVSIPCNFCEKTFRSRNGLRLHKKQYHITANI